MPSYSIEGVQPVVHPSAYVHPTAILIGDVWIGPDCYVGPAASLRGDFGRVVLKEGSNIQDNCVMHAFPGMDTVKKWPCGAWRDTVALSGRTRWSV